MKSKYIYKYCSNCGELFDKKSKTFYVCPKCDFRIFVSPKPAVGLFLFNDQGKLLLLTRSIDPGKGLFGIPGGFINPDESTIDALRREVKEEISIEIENAEYFGSFYGNYEYKGINYKTIDIIYKYQLKNGQVIKINDDESSEFSFYNINDILIESIGTEDVKKAVIELIQSKLH